MLLTVAHIGPKSGKSGVKSNYEALTRVYLDRIAPYIPCQTESFATEAAFLTWLTKPKQSGRTAAFPVLLDSRGRQFSSTEFAAWLGARRDQGLQQIVFAIGPADGWSQTALDAAKTGLLLSFGPITMAHELARLVLAEQLYRACTILSGHPYHSGH
jgi:23S rRNA (pseudouridine1915-N3)-methyltransferase